MTNIRVHMIPILEDNYVFILIDQRNNQALVVDPGICDPVDFFLKSSNLQLSGIILTHHHFDHIGGAKELKKKYSAPIYAPDINTAQLPFADFYLKEGNNVQFNDFHLKVLELPGHTLDHIAYFNPEHRYLFSGDVIFGMGCGRLFEGSPEQMFTSLQKIKALPNDTLIFCTHEYTEKNLEFRKQHTFLDKSLNLGEIEKLASYEKNVRSKRDLGAPTVPLTLDIEKQVNPFLMAPNVDDFRHLRSLRDQY